MRFNETISFLFDQSYETDLFFVMQNAWMMQWRSLMMFLFFEEKWEWYSFLAIFFHIYLYIYINMIFTSFLCKILESYVFFLKNSLSHWMSYIILTLISYKNRIWSSNVLFQELRITSIRVNFNISVDSIFSAKSLLSAIRGLNKKNIICTFLFLMNLFT